MRSPQFSKFGVRGMRPSVYVWPLAFAVLVFASAPRLAWSEPAAEKSGSEKSSAAPATGAAEASDRLVEIESAPRPAQIEPMVAPVKREAPKAPVIKTETSEAAKSSSGKDARSPKGKAKVKVVGEKPNCDAGFKVDASGKSCVKIAESAGQVKKGKK